MCDEYCCLLRSFIESKLVFKLYMFQSLMQYTNGKTPKAFAVKAKISPLGRFYRNTILFRDITGILN